MLEELSEKLTTQILEYKDILAQNDISDRLRQKMLKNTPNEKSFSKNHFLKHHHRKWKSKNY